MRLLTSTALAAVLAMPAVASAQTAETEGTGATTIDAGKIIALTKWDYDANVYAGGWSAENFIDDMEVYGEDGEEIGDVEDLIVDPDGNLIAVIAEIGGFWDIGDTHVSVPWDQVTVNQARDGVVVPVTEENVGEYDAFAYSGLAGSKLGEQVTMGLDDAELGQRAFRLSELIGDYARLRDGEAGTATGLQPSEEEPLEEPVVGAPGAMLNYGYVSDVIIRDGKIAATVVDPAGVYGRGYYAYPYYGYDVGWQPGREFYDLPYTEQEVGELGQFEYDQLELAPEAEVE